MIVLRVLATLYSLSLLTLARELCLYARELGAEASSCPS